MHVKTHNIIVGHTFYHGKFTFYQNTDISYTIWYRLTIFSFFIHYNLLSHTMFLKMRIKETNFWQYYLQFLKNGFINFFYINNCVLKNITFNYLTSYIYLQGYSKKWRKYKYDRRMTDGSVYMYEWMTKQFPAANHWKSTTYLACPDTPASWRMSRSSWLTGIS